MPETLHRITRNSFIPGSGKFFSLKKNGETVRKQVINKTGALKRFILATCTFKNKTYLNILYSYVTMYKQSPR